MRSLYDYCERIFPARILSMDEGVFLKGTVRLEIPGTEGSRTCKAEVSTNPELLEKWDAFARLEIWINGKKTFSIPPLNKERIKKTHPFTSVGKQGRDTITIYTRGTIIRDSLAWIGRVFKKFIGNELSSRLRLQPGRESVLLRKVAVDEITLIDSDQQLTPLYTGLAPEAWVKGVNYAGFLTYNYGIGEAARLHQESLARMTSCPAVPLKMGKNGPSETEDHKFNNPPNRLHHPVTIYHFNPPQYKEVLKRNPSPWFQSRYSIAYWAWEASELPDSWMNSMSHFDEIWVPSSYVKNVVEKKSVLPVKVMPHPVRTPANEMTAHRSEFSIPENTFVCLVLFDINSSIERKNPFAAIQAFQKAFGKDPQTHLVVKVHHEHRFPKEFDHLKQTLQEIPNSTLLTGTFDKTKIMRLIQCCDVYVSLHRAEGYGMVLAEAMSMGTAVIATGWSGNTEFMNPENSCLVGYELKTLESSCPNYPKGLLWAEPSIENASEHLIQLRNDPDFLNKIRTLGRDHITTHFNMDAIGERMLKRLESVYKYIS